MTLQLTWLGHGTWSIESGGKHLLLDPFLNDNPACPVQADDVQADVILISHGHFDHVADAAEIAKRTGANIVSNFEICQWFGSKYGLENTTPMNLGGTVTLPEGKVKSTLAHHSSQLPDGAYGGNPGGFLLMLEGKTLYFACDTALFGDMQLIGKAGGNGGRLDLAVVPIGDVFTMGPADAVESVKLLNPRKAAPAHYNTWPPIAQDAAAWAEQIRSQTSAEPIVIEPGQSFEI